MKKYLKNTAKRIIGSIYYACYKKYQSVGNRALIYHAFGSKLKHDTYGISIDIKNFKHHINFLHKNYKFTHIINKSMSPTNISITIDDGYKDSLDAINVLSAINIPFTIYITSGFINKKDYMSSEDIYEISKLSNCIIGSHGLTHLKFSELDVAKQKHELKESKFIIEDIIGKSIDTLAYPHGSFDYNTISIAKDLGYTSAASSIKGFNNNKTDPFKLKRSEVIASDNIRELSKKIKGYYDFY